MVTVPPASNTIAVIGAGAAGLCSARHLLGCGLRPRIFDARTTVGGMWSIGSISGGNNNGKHTAASTWEGLTTNLSRFTCCFSDFPWSKVDTTTTLHHSAPFVRREEVYDYLQAYRQEYLPLDGESCFSFGCTVTSVIPKEDGSLYQVEWIQHDDGTTHSESFDGVVVATGFFSRPIVPFGSSSVTIHSCDYTSSQDFVDQTVAVVGSSFSALEIAADVAKTARSVVSILPRVPWVLPRFAPFADGTSSSFAPLDLVFYQRTAKNVGGQREEASVMEPDSYRLRHGQLKSIFGTRKQQSTLGMLPNENEPPLISISDHYLDLVAQRAIKAVQGRVKRVTSQGKVELMEENEDSSFLKDFEFDKVIAGTGYRTNLDSFLDADSILKPLQYDPEDGFLPMTDLCFETLHPELDRFGFVGMYRGPYFGVMEQQARLLANLWSGRTTLSAEQIQNAKDMSNKIRQQSTRPQFPHGDYIGFMDSLWRATNNNSNESPPKHAVEGMPIVPAFYQSSDEIADEAMGKVHDELQACRDGKYIPQAVLQALSGSHWTFERTLTHFAIDDDSVLERQEHVHGQVRFLRKGENWDVVLYREDGIYTILSTGAEMEVFREYAYLYNEQEQTMDAHFVEGGKRAHLFLRLRFTPANQDEKNEWLWQAQSDHLCINDLYKGTFQIAFDGIAAKQLEMTYRVRGPEKNYEAVTILAPAE